MVDAWNVTTSEQVMGSCTFCIATLDKKLNQLHYSNVGDGGLMVLRRMADTAEGTAGYSLNVNSDKKGSRRAQGPWRVVYLSQQQMKSFNLPYQLGNNPRVMNEKQLTERKDSAKLSPGNDFILEFVRSFLIFLFFQSNASRRGKETKGRRGILDVFSTKF